MNQKFSTDIESLKKESLCEYFVSSGPGGQRKNKKKTAVKVRHLPSGVSVVATEYRYQAKNRELAFTRLREKLLELNKERVQRITTTKPKKFKKVDLQKKKLHAFKKSLRKKVTLDEIIL